MANRARPRQTEVFWSDVELLLEVGCTANNALLEAWTRMGGGVSRAIPPTERARRRGEGWGARRGARCDGGRIDEIPFSSSFKYMATLDGRDGGGRRLHVKGAPDRVLGYCDRLLLDGEVVELTEELRDCAQAQADFAADALRVIAGAYRDVPAETAEADRIDAECGCVFVGLWGLMDPPRAEAVHAVAAAQRAGIAVKMITGDHAATGSAIARHVGILAEDAPPTAVVTGAELDTLDDDALAARVRDIAVFSRVEPRHKLRIVETLQRLGEVVSMTGDGVNDAPALKRADIGVAMGITGTEVAKEAADMVLADDDFATIVSAVEEGRVIYGNLQRVVAFLVMVALGQVAAIAASQVIGWPLPITPVMVLWANLVVASTLTIPLGIEPKNDDVLSLPPRSPTGDIIDRRAAWRIGTGAALKMVGMLAVFGYFYETSTRHPRADDGVHDACRLRVGAGDRMPFVERPRVEARPALQPESCHRSARWGRAPVGRRLEPRRREDPGHRPARPDRVGDRDRHGLDRASAFGSDDRDRAPARADVDVRRVAARRVGLVSGVIPRAAVPAGTRVAERKPEHRDPAVEVAAACGGTSVPAGVAAVPQSALEEPQHLRPGGPLRPAGLDALGVLHERVRLVGVDGDRRLDARLFQSARERLHVL